VNRPGASNPVIVNKLCVFLLAVNVVVHPSRLTFVRCFDPPIAPITTYHINLLSYSY
jgi:hypothetical protein